ncbi:MAG: response regulator transcription factor [Ardenticatenaceae bacterium]|nr:response regulator transcription factor [Ardenticatenaceae bacterium]
MAELSEPIRILLVDDHAIVRKGLRALLTEIDDVEVVGEAADGEQAISQAAALQPDVILMDIVMPNMDGIEATQFITRRQPEARVLALTSFASDDKLFPAIKAGALGYLLKDSDPDDLIEAIRQVHRGEPSLHPRIARKLLHELGRPLPQEQSSPQPQEAPDPLTAREVEVLRAVAKGLSNQQIADALSIAEVTVRTHVSHILDKLHLANRVQATLYALREGLTTLDNDDP